MALFRISVKIGSGRPVSIERKGGAGDDFLADILAHIAPSFDPETDDAATVVLRSIKRHLQTQQSDSTEGAVNRGSELKAMIATKKAELMTLAPELLDNEAEAAAKRLTNAARRAMIDAKRIQLGDPEEEGESATVESEPRGGRA